MKTRMFFFVVSFFLTATTFSQDPNFYIYVCFGQSNMEGQGSIETQDRTVDSRFKVMQSLDCSNLSRTKGEWYTATPPLCQCWSKLSPADYFGRTMVANLPDSITIGVINVAVGGCDIRLFDKDIYMDYDSTYAETWFTSKVEAYGWNPYQHLIDLALQAQQDGVIKGILLHQGETNTGQSQWPSYVQKIYTDMLADLSLSADSVPLLAGEVLSVPGNCCASMNSIINTLPQTIETAYVISSDDCPGQDNAHFNSEGYRILGRRYAVQMLNLMGYEALYIEPECAVVGENWGVFTHVLASNAAYVIPGGESVVNITTVPADSANLISMEFSLNSDTTYFVYGRFNNASSDSDAMWIKVDDGAFQLIDNLITDGWEWKELLSLDLSVGTHTITVAIAEKGVMFDKIAIKNSQIVPISVGEEAIHVCVPEFSVGLRSVDAHTGYFLGQSYPNPFSGHSIIPFAIPVAGFVSILVYDSQGIEIVELAGKEYDAGNYTVQCNLDSLPAGNYFYKMNAGQFSEMKQMVKVSDSQ